MTHLKILLLSISTIFFLTCTRQEDQGVAVDNKEGDSSKGTIVQAMPSKSFEVIRLKNNPIIYPDMPGLEGEAGRNINGPSLIGVPRWIRKPLGKYYLYFAHHRGKYIRLAYADNLEGPWTVHQPGTLHMKDAPGIDHIASPDVQVDHEEEEILMYFHQPASEESGIEKQVTYVAISKDGISFKANKEVLGKPYFRVFKYNRRYYAVAKNYRVDGEICRSIDGLTRFEEGRHFVPKIRHTAVWIENDTLYMLYTVIGDCPERILLSTFDLKRDWQQWMPSPPEIILEPETEYEGAKLPLEPSKESLSLEPVRQLRDPAIFQEDGKMYLLYSVAGEQGIAIARFQRKKTTEESTK